MPVRIPVEATRLEQSILDQVRSAGRKIGKKGGINLGTSAKSIESLSQPLGRITGKADQFTKSMEAANARVLAFGASVGVLSAVTRGFKDLVVTTIEVEKSLASINAIMGASSNELERFKKTIFDVARNTEQSFDTVANAALEFSRQGLKAQEVVERLNDSMILARLSGLGAGEAVAGLTAAINSFNSTGIKSSEVLNKLSAAAAAAAVSERDLIEGIKRSGAVAIQAGVTFDELVGVISSVQEKTARGGAVIGNSFKTIFTRLQSLEKLKTMRDLGVEVTDASGAVHSATQLIDNLAKSLRSLPSAERLQIAENLVGKFQVAPFLAILEDMSKETSRYADVTRVAGQATNEAYTRNIALNKTLAAAINEAGVNLKELANTLGEIGVTDSLKNVLGFFNSLVTGIKNLLEGEGIGSDFARGIVKGIGNVISGPGLAIFGAIIAKLTLDLVKFGGASLKTFFGMGSAAKQIAQAQGQIAATLLNNKAVQDQILKIENSTLTVEQKRVAQTQYFTSALNTQLAAMQKMQALAGKIAPGVVRGTRGRAAGGYIPNFDAVRGYGSEQVDINRGVGGAPPSARPVTIPNFAFGGGRRGTVTANSSEFIVPNFAGGGSAIFNQNMVSSMGLPAGARRVGAAGGYIPNFAAAKRSGGRMAAQVNAAEQFVLFTGQRDPGNPATGKSAKSRIMYVGKKAGKSTAYTTLSLARKSGATAIAPVNVPVYQMGPRGTNKKGPDEITRIKTGLSDSAAGFSKKFAHELSAKKDLPSLTRKQIEGLFNKGAFEGFAGSVFEVSLASILGSRQFLDYSSRTDTSRIDLPYSTQLFKKFGAMGKGLRGAEVKANASTELVGGAAVKFYDVLKGGLEAARYKKGFLGKHVDKPTALARYGIGPLTYKAINTKFGGVNRGSINQWRMARGEKSILGLAGGYIPNYAGGNPLADAIDRESSAGLPINQIRINQTSRLRNAGNPMGLAVTNTRDEPTGRIPSFAKKPMGGEMGATSGDLMMKFMGLTMAASMLSGVFSQMGEESSNFSKGMGEATQALMMMAMMAMMGGGKMGFAPLKRGGMGNVGAARMQKGMIGLRGRDTRMGPALPPGHRFLQQSKGGAASRVVLGGIGRGASLFGRLLPVVGQLIFAFQGVIAVAKMFGHDLGGSMKEFLTPLGISLNLIDSPAEKTAKALDKLGDQAYKTALASGFQEKAFEDFFKNIRTAAAEEKVRGTLGSKVKKGESALSKKLELDTEAAAFKAVETDVMKGLGVRMGVGSFFTPGKAGRDEFSATFAGDLSTEEIRKKIDETVEARRKAFPDSSVMANPMSFTTFKESTRQRKEEEEFQKQIAETRRKARVTMESGTIDEKEALRRSGTVTGLLSATQMEALGGARSAALGAFGSRQENQELARLANLGADTTAQQDKMIAGFDEEETRLYAKLQKEIREGKLTELEAEKEILELAGKKKKASMVQVQTQKIQESLAKAQLKNMVELTTMQVKMATEADLEAKTRLALLSTSTKEKAELEGQVAARERQRELVAEQIKATSKLVQSQGQFAQQLKSRNPTENINAEQFEKVKDLVEATNQKIIEQGGYNEKVGEQLFNQLKSRGLSATLAQDVVDLVAETNGHLQKQSDITADIYNNEKLRAAVADARLKSEQRTLSNLQAELSLQGELHKMVMETEAINLRIAELEGQKIGKNKKDSLAIERLISVEKEKQLRLDARRETTRINEGLRQDIFGAAKAAGLDLGQLTSIQGQLRGVEGMGIPAQRAFSQIISNIEKASKEADKARIEAAAEEKLNALNNAALEIEAAITAGDEIRQAGRDFRQTILSFLPKGGIFHEALAAADEGISKSDSKARGASKTALAKIFREMGATEFQLGEDLATVDKRGRNIELENRFMAGFMEQDKVMSNLATQLAGLNNEMARAAKIFATFKELVDGLFDGLDEELARLRLDRFMQTSATGLIQNARDQKFVTDKMRIDEDKTLTPSQRAARVGRLEEGRVREDLKLQARLSTTASGANEALRQLGVLKEIWEVKQKMEQGLLSEVAGMEKLVQLEKKRLTINDSLKATFQKEFVKKDSEIARSFNEKFVGAARAFSTELTHGIVDAIAKGEDLKGVLLGAATGFLNTMSKAFMDRAVDNLVSGLFPSGGSIGGAKGGSVRGGSGMKDDVPALLMGGEFVMRKKAVSQYGPRFFEALNTGAIPAMANGGLFLPGTRGQGAISGKRDLLSFATQSSTGGGTDMISSGSDFVSAFLEPESPRLTQWGRRNNATWQRVQDAKREAFGLYVQQLGQDEDRKRREAELKKQKKAQKKAFWRSLGMAALSAGVSWGTGQWAGRKVGTAGMDPYAQISASPSQGSGQGWLQRTFGYAAGGAVPYSAGVDTIPSMLSGGEFVMNSAATQRLGAGNLEAVNAGGGLGGDNGEVLKRLDNIAEASRGETQINITVNSNGSSEEDSRGDDSGNQRGKNLAIRIKDAVREVIASEQRLGGMLTN